MNEGNFDQQYQELFEFAHDSYLLTDLGGVIHEANRAAAAMLNMQPRDLVGKPLVIFVAQAEHKVVFAHLHQLLEKDDQSGRLRLVGLEITLQPSGQLPFPAAVTFNLTHDAAGQPAGLLCQLCDISVQKQMEAEIHRLNDKLERQTVELTAQLHGSEARYCTLVEQIPAITYTATLDEASSTATISRQIEQLCNTPVEWLADPKLWADRLHPEDRARVLAEIARSWANGEPFHCEYRLLARDDRTVWFRDDAHVVRGETGQSLCLQGVMLDITERKQAEVALQESALQLENQKHFIARILESIPSSLVVIDRAMRVVSVNHNFLEKTHREEQATLSRKIEEVFPQVLLKYTRLGQRIQDVFRTGQPVEGGKVAYRAPGLPTRTYYYRLIPIYLAPRPLLSGSSTAGHKALETGQIENVMLLMDDVTEREQLVEEVRRVERHLAGVVECANDLVVSMDPQGLIVTWNRAAETVSGLKTEQAKGHSLVSLCAPQQQPVMDGMLHKLARGASVQHTEVDLLTAKGQEVPIAWSCSPMRDDASHVAGIVAVGRDLTEQRRLEDQLIHSAKMASLGVMAGGIAHELRNPLGIISASAQLLLESPEDAQLRGQGLQKIHTATQRASLIIENLLKFSRPQDGRKREVDVHAVLEETLALLDHQMALQKVTLQKEFQPNLPAVSANPELLQQVFANLILNACNAMPLGGTLTVATQSGEAAEVLIQFKDTGRGIPAEHLQQIFDPFFTTMPVGKGVGLGLSISHSIVEQHQGVIEAQSQLGKGSTFTVRLPGVVRS